MKSEETLPLIEQVGETKAEAEDRLEQTLVPRIEAAMAALSNRWTALRDRLASRHSAER